MRQDKRSLDYQKAIKESVARLSELEGSQSKALLRDRMRFLRLLKSGECRSQAQAGRVIGLGLRGAEKLWKKYRKEGLAGLLTYPYQGTQPKLSPEGHQGLEQELAKDQIQSLREACAYTKSTFGVSYTEPGMWYVFRRLKVKKKTARPTHVHKDEAGEKRFKKKPSRS